MKKILSMILVPATLCMLASCGNGVPKGFQEEPSDTAADTVGTFDYAAMASLDHPRLLLTSDGFKDLKRKLKKNAPEYSTLKRISDTLISHADYLIASGRVPEYKLDASGKRLLTQSRITLNRLSAFSYAYRVTGDQKYLDAAKADLATVCAFKDWHPSHYLDTGEMALAVAIAYDWLYYDLSLEERILAHKCMAEYALKICHKQWYIKGSNNWNQVCNCGMIAAAIAVYDKDKALSTRVIEQAVQSNFLAQNAMYAPDGAYHEGYGYWSYGTGFETVLLQILDTAFGNDAGLSQTPGFLATGNYMLYMSTPNNGNFSYADGGGGSESIKPGMWWFAAKLADQSLLMNEIRMLDAGKYSGGTDELRIFAAVPAFIKDLPIDVSKKVKPSKDMWYGRGIVPMAMIHTGWDFNENDVYLGMMASGAGHSHSHMDAGAFVFESNGVRWSADLSRPNYATMENALREAGGDFWAMSQNSLRWDIVRMNNVCHSTITFENSDGSVPGKVHKTDQVSTALGTMVEVYEDKNAMGAKFDISPAFADQAASVLRTVLLVDGKTVRVIDEVTAKPGMAAKMQWRMLTPAAVEVKADGEVLTHKGKTLCLTATSSDASIKPAYTTWSAERPSDWVPRTWDPSNADYTLAGYKATVPAGKTVTFTTVLSE